MLLADGRANIAEMVIYLAESRFVRHTGPAPADLVDGLLVEVSGRGAAATEPEDTG